MKKMSTQFFIDTIHDEYKAGQRYCFILGSGASVTSGIRMGSELLKDWFEFLTAPGRGLSYAKERAELIGLKPADYEYLFAPGYTPSGKDYFALYDLRYAGAVNAGFQDLEKEMEGKSPYVGYYLLAFLLEQTENRYVITTNFDSLSEDAYFYYTNKHPLVVGHESLAPFVGGNFRRPVIAKIHRDLYLNPKNHKKEMQQLSKEWHDPLTKLLTQYIPIVIGYAGEDLSLMSLLKKIPLPGIFWCTRPGKEPNDNAKKIIEANNGYHVVIEGFDEILFDLANRFPLKSGTPMGSILAAMESFSKDRMDKLTKVNEEFSNRSAGRNATKGSTGNTDSADVEADSKPESTDARTSKNPMIPYNDALNAYKNDDFESALRYIDEAIALKPDHARFHKLRGDILDDLNLTEKAIVSYSESIRLNPDSFDTYNNRGLALMRLHRPEEALSDYNKAIELNPDLAGAYLNCGLALMRLHRSEEAHDSFSKAIELDPDYVLAYNGRGIALMHLHRSEEAFADFSKAIELDPDYTFAYNARGTALINLHRPEEALADFNKAIELDPDFPGSYYNRGLLYRSQNRLQEALADFAKAAKLDPENSDDAISRDELQQQLNSPS